MHPILQVLDSVLNQYGKLQSLFACKHTYFSSIYSCLFYTLLSFHAWNIMLVYFVCIAHPFFC
jgi:hypothetical protein